MFVRIPTLGFRGRVLFERGDPAREVTRERGAEGPTPAPRHRVHAPRAEDDASLDGRHCLLRYGGAHGRQRRAFAPPYRCSFLRI